MYQLSQTLAVKYKFKIHHILGGIDGTLIIQLRVNTGLCKLLN